MKAAPTLTDLQKQVGAAIRQQRNAAGLSLRDLEANTGMSRANISRLETGKYNFTIETLYTISKAIGCSVASLFSASPPTD